MVRSEANSVMTALCPHNIFLCQQRTETVSTVNRRSLQVASEIRFNRTGTSRGHGLWVDSSNVFCNETAQFLQCPVLHTHTNTHTHTHTHTNKHTHTHTYTHKHL